MEKFFIRNRFHEKHSEQGTLLLFLYSKKIKEQTRKLAAGCSKHRFEVVDKTDEVSNHTYGKVKLT